MKLVESQLLASLAAAAARTDAATLRSQRLAAALDAATAKLATAASKAAESDDSSCAENECLEAEITHCKTQIVARDQEVYRLQDHLLQAKQVKVPGTCKAYTHVKLDVKFLLTGQHK